MLFLILLWLPCVVTDKTWMHIKTAYMKMNLGLIETVLGYVLMIIIVQTFYIHEQLCCYAYIFFYTFKHFKSQLTW